MIVLASFVVLMLIGAPISISLGLPAAAYLFIKGMPIEMIAIKVVTSLDSFTTMSAMFFILAGTLFNKFSISGKLFNLAEKSVGHFRGGLAHSNILASVIFAGMSGSALADAAGLGTIEIEEMRKRKYSKEMSIGVTGASSIIGPIIPPSIPMVFYAVVAGASVGKLFLGGIIPGLVTAVTLAVTVVIMARRERVEKLAKPKFGEWFRVFIDSLPSIGTIVILLGGIFGGLFTPTEASVVAVLYTIILGVVYRKFTWKGFIEALFNSMRITIRIMFIVACASIFGQVIIRTRMAVTLANAMTSVISSPVIILIAINFLLLIIGCFLEQIAAILVITPIVLPIMTSLGLSPIQSGIIIVFNLMVGLFTPPFGLVLFTLADIGKLSMKRTIKGVLPYVVPLIVTLAIITFVPWVVDFLPNLLF